MPSFPTSSNAYKLYLCDELQCKDDYVEYWKDTTFCDLFLYIHKWLWLMAIMIPLSMIPGAYLFFAYGLTVTTDHQWFSITWNKYYLDSWYCILQTILTYLLITRCYGLFSEAAMIKLHISNRFILLISLLYNLIIGGTILILIVYFTLNNKIKSPNIYCNKLACKEESYHFLYLHTIYRICFPLCSIITFTVYTYYKFKKQTNSMNNAILHRAQSLSFSTTTQVAGYSRYDVDSVDSKEAINTIYNSMYIRVRGVIFYTFFIYAILFIIYLPMGVLSFADPQKMQNKDNKMVEYGYYIFLCYMSVTKALLKIVSRRIDQIILLNNHYIKKTNAISMQYITEFIMSMAYWLYFKQYLVLHTAQLSRRVFMEYHFIHYLTETMQSLCKASDWYLRSTHKLYCYVGKSDACKTSFCCCYSIIRWFSFGNQVNEETIFKYRVRMSFDIIVRMYVSIVAGIIVTFYTIKTGKNVYYFQGDQFVYMKSITFCAASFGVDMAGFLSIWIYYQIINKFNIVKPFVMQDKMQKHVLLYFWVIIIGWTYFQYI